ncbi:divergent polysaccharide deacetylase family protein, partial [Frigidibacter oleivorans]|uniref:divergent polysaccharide deacetylase family protein n=1 Tax=Frigidibacter oleivorans TaxID=2487129 RepID=UPI000F8EB691
DVPAAPAADTEVAALGSAAAPRALDRPVAEERALPVTEPAPAPPAPAAPEAEPAPEDPADDATAPAPPEAPATPPLAPPASEAPALPDIGTALPVLPPAAESAPDAAPAPPVVQSIAPSEPAAPVILRPGSQPSPGFAGAAGVRVNRPGSTEPEPATAADPQPEEQAQPLPALVAYAAPFMAPPGAPLLAVLLMQSADSPVIPAELLADLPFPVTIAIDPTLPDAAATAELYRAAGQEVAILAALPPGAQPQDIEIAWQEYRRLLPEAVAVVDLPDAAVQNDRVLATQLVELTGAAGQGLLVWNRGLAPAAQLADAAGVPGARIYRDLDAGGESAPVIGRYLDRAAFEASRTGAVVVAGSTRSETLAALLDWALAQSRAVTLAPVSAVLMRDM